jgi:hypothetical protein
VVEIPTKRAGSFLVLLSLLTSGAKYSILDHKIHCLPYRFPKTLWYDILKAAGEIFDCRAFDEFPERLESYVIVD